MNQLRSGSYSVTSSATITPKNFIVPGSLPDFLFCLSEVFFVEYLICGALKSLGFSLELSTCGIFPLKIDLRGFFSVLRVKSRKTQLLQIESSSGKPNVFIVSRIELSPENTSEPSKIKY